MRFGTYLFLILPFFCALRVMASPNSLTYQGRILKSDGSPLEHNNVSFLFEITNPSGTCVVYREQKNAVNLVNSGGVFDVPIGTGTKLFPASPTKTLLSVFDNTANLDCADASNNVASTYTPAQGHLRLLRVQFHDGTGWKVISPDSEIRSVPYSAFALSAQTLGSKTADDFILKTGVPTCAPGTFLSYDGSTLSCAAVSGASGGTVTNVTSGNSYITIINNTSTPVLTLNVGTSANTVAAGNDSRFSDARAPTGGASGDLSGTYPNPSVVKIQGTSVSAVAPTTGQFFKYNGTNWLAATIGIADVSGLSTSLGSYMTQADFNSAVSTGTCLAYETMYWNSVSSNFQCRAINVSLVGDVSGTIGATSVDKIKGVAVDTTAPTTGQVLKYDGTKWGPAADNNAGGTVTNVTTSAPLSVTNGNTTPALSIQKADATHDGYLAQADFTAFSNKQAAGNYLTALTGDVTASGPGSASSNVAKLQGSTLTITTPANKDYLKYNGSAFVNSPLLASDLSGTLPAANLPAFTGGDVTSSAGSAVLTLASAGTAGTYFKVTTDSKGRVTSGATSLTATDIPALDWTKITTGKPTSLSGYGIVDALVLNAGGTPSIQTGLDTSKPASPGAGAIYFATDSKVIYQYNAGAWVSIASAAGAGGTVSSVSSSNAYLSVATATSTPALTLNVGTSANTVAAGNDSRIVNAVQNNGNAKNIVVDTMANKPAGGAVGDIYIANDAGAVFVGTGGGWKTVGTTNLAWMTGGPLSIANGGTGAINAVNAFNALSPLTTKGDLVTSDGSNNVRLAAGTNGLYLQADNTQASGLKWSSVSATDISSLATTGIVQRTGSGAFTTLGVTAPLNIAASNIGLAIGNGLTLNSGNLVVDTGTTANKILQLDASAKIPAVDGSQLTNLNASALTSGTIPAARLPASSNAVYFPTSDASANASIAIGASALQGQTVSANYYNTVMGYSSMASTMTGAATENTAMGAFAMQSTTSGFANTAMGSMSLMANTSGYDNTSMGRWALKAASTGNYNSALGALALYKVTTGGSNIGIGYMSGGATLTTGSNNILIGNSTDTVTASASNFLNIGNVLFATGMTGSVTSPAGKIGIGTTAPTDQLTVYKANASSTASIVSDNTSGNSARYPALSVINYMGSPSTGSGGNPSINLTNFRGTSASTSPMKNGESLGALVFNGASDTSTNYLEGASIWAMTTQNYSSTAGGTQLQFHTTPNNSTTAASRLTIDQNGFVGLGTDSPIANLHIVGTGTGNSAYSSLQMGNDATAANNFHWVNEYNAGRSLRLYSGNLGSGAPIMSINQTGLIIGETGSAGAGVLTLKAGTADHVYIQLFARTGSPGTRSGYIGYPAATATNLDITNETLNGIVKIKTNNAGSVIDAVTVTANGNMTIAGTNYNTSDRRMKKDITPLAGNLQNILKLNPVSYHWIDSKKDSTLQTGFVAQEIETIYPHVVQTNDKGFKSVSYISLIAPLAGAIREMYTKFTSLFANHETRLVALEAQMKDLKQQNELLRQQNEQLAKVLKSQNEKAQRIPAAADK